MNWKWVWHEAWHHDHQMEFLDDRPGHELLPTYVCSCGHVTESAYVASAMDGKPPPILVALAIVIVAAAIWWF